MILEEVDQRCLSPFVWGLFVWVCLVDISPCISPVKCHGSIPAQPLWISLTLRGWWNSGRITHTVRHSSITSCAGHWVRALRCIDTLLVPTVSVLLMILTLDPACEKRDAQLNIRRPTRLLCLSLLCEFVCMNEVGKLGDQISPAATLDKINNRLSMTQSE